MGSPDCPQLVRLFAQYAEPCQCQWGPGPVSLMHLYEPDKVFNDMCQHSEEFDEHNFLNEELCMS